MTRAQEKLLARMEKERSTRSSLEAQLAAIEARRTLNQRTEGPSLHTQTGVGGRERRSSFSERLRRLSGSVASPADGLPSGQERKRRLSARTGGILAAGSSAIASVFSTSQAHGQPREADTESCAQQKTGMGSERGGVFA